MLCNELTGKRVVIWGAGKEGCAAARLLRQRCASCSFVFADEQCENLRLPEDLRDCSVDKDVEHALANADLLVKSPGVSLYHPFLADFKARGGSITSLLNLWTAEVPPDKLVAITGTKGKSTTTSLLVHVLCKLGKKAVALGNIGIPVSECVAADYDLCVIEVSSYQAADFDGLCGIGVMTSFFPEHLDWHKSQERYCQDKRNLLAHCRTKLVESSAAQYVVFDDALLFQDEQGLYAREAAIFDHGQLVGELRNDFLARQHNLGNVCAVLSVIKALGMDMKAALMAMDDYAGLPHRQQLVRDDGKGTVFIDDSISTTPQSAVAAMSAFQGKPIALIAGGQDRGIDFAFLCDYVALHDVHVVCLGESGPRIFQALEAKGIKRQTMVGTMRDAVAVARACLTAGGVVLLSPASPSYDMYKNYIDRAEDFLRCIDRTQI